jgi:hypothetical protein
MLETTTFAFENVSIAVAGLTTVGTIEGKGYTLSGWMGLEVVNQDLSNALDAFNLYYKVHPSGSWYTYLEGAEWAEPVAATPHVKVQHMNVGPDDLAASGSSISQIWIPASYAIRFQASANTGIVVISAYGNIQHHAR